MNAFTSTREPVHVAGLASALRELELLRAVGLPHAALLPDEGREP